VISFDDYRALMCELDDLVAWFELHPDFPTRARAVKLLSGLDMLHREALSRLVEALQNAGGGPALEQARVDDVVAALLSLCDLGDDALPDGVHAVELGIGGIGLVHELMDGYDALVIVDAVDRNGAPGTVYVLEPEVPTLEAIAALEGQSFLDMHEVVPARALVLARAAGVLPPLVRIIGCQPGETEDLSMQLSAVVAPAVAVAIDRIFAFVASLPGALSSETLRRRDEILQVLFWLRGELGPEVAVADVLRFVDDATAVREVLEHLVDEGYAERCGDARYRLTSLGEDEGRRRFLDEFEPYLTRGHGECGVADCDCHAGGECRNAR
jgi:hydrogenase maturation protease